MLVRMWRKGNTWALLVGMQNGAANVENSMGGGPQKINNRIIIWSSHVTPILTAALFTIAKTWNNLVSTDRWMDKEEVVCVHTHAHTRTHTHTHTHTHTLEYHSAIGEKEIMPLATTWMELQGIVLSEISQTEKDKNHMISLLRKT